MEWFEQANRQDFQSRELGDSLERAEAMQCHLDEIRRQAQVNLEATFAYVLILVGGVVRRIDCSLV